MKSFGSRSSLFWKPEQPPPFQPVNVESLVGVAVSVVAAIGAVVRDRRRALAGQPGSGPPRDRWRRPSS